MGTKEYVEYLLKNYYEIKKQLSVLRFEIEHFTGLNYEDVIAALSFEQVSGERVTTSSISDKTGKIALIYREIAENQNNEILKEHIKKYYEQKKELELLDYCISVLSDILSGVITDLFINQISWIEISKKYSISLSMVGKCRKKGIIELTKLFESSKKVGVEYKWNNS